MNEHTSAWDLLVNLKESLKGLRAVFSDLSDQSILKVAELLVPDQQQIPEPPKSRPCPGEAKLDPGERIPEDVVVRTMSAEDIEPEVFTSEDILEFIRENFSHREFTYLEVANAMGIKRAKIVSGGISVLARKGIVRSVRHSRQKGNVWELVK